jgi:cobalt/nickel transport system permease protein
MFNISIALRLQLSLIVVIGTAFLKKGAWTCLAIYGAIALFSSVIQRVPLRRLTGLLGTELIFLLLTALPLGWEKASFLLARSVVCLLTMNTFLLTLPKHSFGIALKSLPLPRGLKESLLLAGQYLEILLDEVKRMQKGAQLRGLSGTAVWLRYASASMIGSLYIRSLERAERVYAAMVARGYNGQLPQESTLTNKELTLLIIAVVISTCVTTASYLLSTGI